MSSKCNRQADYHNRIAGKDAYLCYEHYKEPEKRIVQREFSQQMTDAEKHGKRCTYGQ